jgi:hypothetical protein
VPELLVNQPAPSAGLSLPCHAVAGSDAPRAGVRLSIAHTDSLAPAKLHPNTFRTWREGSISIIPAGENKNPNLSKSAPRRGIRGKITTLSKGARNRIKETISTIKAVPAYTYAFTLPEECWGHPPEFIHKAFQKLSRQFTASSRWQHVGIIYKREFTEKGVLHYHIAVYGLAENEKKELQRWLTRLWVSLIASSQPFEVRKKMSAVHNHKKNFDLVRTTIASYFAKYLGKALNAPNIFVPGKWWGIINRHAIPFADEKQLILPDFIRDRARRRASKAQEKRNQHALFISFMRKLNFVYQGKPMISLQQFHAAKNYDPNSNGWHNEGPIQDRKHLALHIRNKMIDAGYRQGRHKHPRPSSFGRITLIGSNVPAMMERIIRHAFSEMVENRKSNPF